MNADWSMHPLTSKTIFMTDHESYPLLSTIDSPADLHSLSTAQLEVLASELRSFLLECLDNTGGHLSSGLGAIELTVALHAVFNAPVDNIVWDVGHQSYPHKILTGRMQQMHSIRTRGGLSGFPKRSESPYDAFGVGHSSTSIGAALGMALAAKTLGEKRKSIAVIGDGAMTAGMAFEALNHAGDMDADILVILNDNDMSISPNVGGLSNYFAKVLSGKLYSSMRANSKKMLGAMPSVWELARRAEEHMKGMIIPGTLFEELGFNYIGPIDGHDLPTLLTTLKNIRELSGPQFLHIVTRKGKGFKEAEQDPVHYHAVKPGFYSEEVNTSQSIPSILTYTEVFSQWICDAADKDERLIGITPAMREGSGLVEFSQQFADRYYDVGIAEQHSVTLAAGMACNGLKPVVAIYSSFLQRAYDQLIHDVALQNLPVLFAIDRAGIVGPDGATHAGSFDLSFMRCIPNMSILAPSNENECYHMLESGFAMDSPVAVRYPRGNGIGAAIEKTVSSPIKWGKAEIVLAAGQAHHANRKVIIFSFGSLLQAALTAAQQLQDQYQFSVVNMRFIKPLDKALVLELAASADLIITLEDNSIMGGAGSAVNEVLADQPPACKVINLGIPDQFPDHGTQNEIYHAFGLDSEGISATITRELSQ